MPCLQSHGAHPAVGREVHKEESSTGINAPGALHLAVVVSAQPWWFPHGNWQKKPMGLGTAL